MKHNVGRQYILEGKIIQLLSLGIKQGPLNILVLCVDYKISGLIKFR